MAIHGAIRDMSVNGRNYKVAHDGSGNKNLGGKTNEIQMNGDGTYRTIQTLMPGSFTDVQVEIDDGRGDHEFLKTIADAGAAVPVVITYADNTSYSGDVVLVAEINPDQNTGLASLSFSGGNLAQL
jgi:hypothetical protein